MSANTQQERTEVIETINGPIKGIIRGDMQLFLGIPYAAPPTGKLRWRPPVTPAAWTEPLEAFTFGNVCAQDALCFPGFGYISSTEDCLYLNIFRPAHHERAQKLPVMVWIPGGGLFCGGSNDYDPTALVQDGNVIFVSFNYRLNVFGFFSHPALNEEDHPGGNYGIMDQQCALSWVQCNIERFCGDTSNVTIFGESAGGISVLSHLASPRSTGLFHKAIVQSGGLPPTSTFPNLKSLEQAGVAFASAAGCDSQTSENLRAIPTKKLMEANAMPEGTFGTGQYYCGLIEDGTIIPVSMRQKFSAGEFNRVPLINGVNRDEYSWFQAMVELSTGQIVSNESYPGILANALTEAAQLGLLSMTIAPDTINEVLQRYPAEAHATASRALAAAIGDAGIISTSGRRTTRVIKQFVPDVYAYEFDVPESPVSWPKVSFPYGSAHTQELQYIFPLFHGASGTVQQLTEPQKHLAKQIVHYWTTFARRGTPNAETLATLPAPYWPAYETEQDNIMLLRAPSAAATVAWGERHHSDFWDRFYV